MKKLAIIAACSLSLLSCRKPAPLDIEIPQEKESLVVSSLCQGNHSLFVAAGYSINSSVNVDSLTNDKKSLQDEMMMAAGTVTIQQEGMPATNLSMITKGVYGSRNLSLIAGAKYTITVKDDVKNITTSATTTYMPRPDVTDVAKQVRIAGTDTTVQLKFTINRATAGKYYYVSYTTSSQKKAAGRPQDLESLQSFESKKIHLYSSADAEQERISKTISISAKTTDTVFVEIGAIDAHYYRYLDAYIRTGYLVNMVTGEPVNLPTNLSSGYGYFALCNPYYKSLDVKEGLAVE